MKSQMLGHSLGRSFASALGLLALVVIALSVTPVASDARSSYECHFCLEIQNSCVQVMLYPESFGEDEYTNCDELDLGEPADSVAFFEINTYHKFPNPFGDQCTEHDPPAECARCNGGTSTCHTVWWIDDCHIPCSGSGFAALVEEVEVAVGAADHVALARVVADESSASFDAVTNHITLRDCNDQQGVLRVAVGRALGLLIAGRLQRSSAGAVSGHASPAIVSQ